MKTRFGMAKISVLALGVFLLWAVPSLAATRYVDAANTSGIEDGTAASPFDTIMEAIDQAVSGDVVTVAPGIYYGQVILKGGVPLVSSQGPAVTVIDGMNQPYAVSGYTYVPERAYAIEGFTVQNAEDVILTTIGYSIAYQANVEVRNCVIRGGSNSGVNVRPFSAFRMTDTLITDVFSAINVGHFNWPYITNVTIDRAKYAFRLANVWWGGTTYLNNTTISNAECVFGGDWYNFYPGAAASVRGSSNNLWNYVELTQADAAGKTPAVDLLGTLAANPQFVDSASGNYRLQSGSPLIDAGIVFPYGRIEFVGSAPDIGAYESDFVDFSTYQGPLAESYQEAPPSAFKSSAEQRRNALHNKLSALFEQLGQVRSEMPVEMKIDIYSQALDKLQNDIMAKSDGFFGGNPKNDWITSQEEQQLLYPGLQDLAGSIQAEVSRLQGL